MKMLPWLCVVGLVIGLGWVYSASQKKDTELAALREESQQLPKLRAELEETKTVRAQAEGDELTRLRKEHDELLRLRNEVRQLRADKQQLATQVQTAQAQTQSAQQQVQTLRSSAGQPSPAGQPALGVRPGLSPVAAEQANTLACINHLRLIDGAKQQWALEKRKERGAMPTSVDLAPYLKTNAMPTCPAGGVYTPNPVYLAPICNIPGHALPK